jgi:hypothetical protein
MKVLAIYAINEHIADLMFEAEQARLARRTPSRPSLLSRASAAARLLVTRLAPSASPALLA